MQKRNDITGDAICNLILRHRLVVWIEMGVGQFSDLYCRFLTVIPDGDFPYLWMRRRKDRDGFGWFA